MALRHNEKMVYTIEALFASALIVFLALSQNATEFFKSYYIAIAAAVLALIARSLLGYKKDNNFMRASAARTVVACCMFFGIVAFALGILLGFSRGFLTVDVQKIMSGFVPILITALATEYMRYIIASSQLRSSLQYYLFTVLSIALNSFAVFNAAAFASPEKAFVFLSGSIVPIVAVELCCAYLCTKFGFMPALIYKLIFALYPYLLPIVPTLGEYIHAVLWLTISFVIYFLCNKLMAEFEKDLSRFHRRNRNLLAVPLIVASVVLVCLVSGIFDYQIIAIGSDSMRPIYSRGDAVIFEKIGTKEVIKGDILVFNKNNQIITHRVVEIEEENGIRNYITKGDANEERDSGSVSESDVLGRVRLYTKYIGFPTLWFKSIFNGEKL